MIFIDTGFLLAVAKPSDALHNRALKWAAFLGGRFLVTEYVLWELLNALSAPPDRAKGHVILARVQSPNWCEFVPASPELFQDGVDLHRDRPDKSWSLTDCISFQIMREREIRSALAFDQYFEQAGFEALLRQDPPK